MRLVSLGLFQKVISMSGTAVRKYTTTDRQDEQLVDFGSKFGCNGGSSKEMLECLKGIDGATLVEAHREASVSQTFCFQTESNP